ncbi:helix-turn-helix domain-containing protein [Paenibacillus castaneae]|nr:helix-turn-helix domain-containing protein [Paenibacillus castaneae]
MCKLIHESILLPVFFIQADEMKLTDSYGGHDLINPLFTTHENLIRSIINHVKVTDYPLIQTSQATEQFIIVPVKRMGNWLGTVVIGPTLAQVPSDETIATIVNDLKQTYQQTQWKEYLHRLPFASGPRLLHISVLAHLVLNGQVLDMTTVIENHFRFEKHPEPERLIQIELSFRKEFSIYHTMLDVERLLLQHIRNGNKSALLNMMGTTAFEDAGVLSKHSHLRSRKNLAICAIAIATRAAMDGGLYMELAYTLSDLYIQHIEELNDTRSVEVAMADAMLDFADRVHLTKKSRLSKPVAACQEYIFNHLYEEIPLNKLSESTGLNANYLSNLFKKETGMTIRQFIQRERVEEARNLLYYTTDPISMIASRLNFYDQTYFIKVFKKHIGTTPKQYRNKKIISTIHQLQ